MNKHSNLSVAKSEPSEGRAHRGLKVWSFVMGIVLILASVMLTINFLHILNSYLRNDPFTGSGDLALSCSTAVIAFYVGLCLLIPYRLYRKPVLRAFGFPALLASIVANMIAFCVSAQFVLWAIFIILLMPQQPVHLEDILVGITEYLLYAFGSAAVLLLSAPAALLLFWKIKPSGALLILDSKVIILLMGVLICAAWAWAMVK